MRPSLSLSLSLSHSLAGWLAPLFLIFPSWPRIPFPPTAILGQPREPRGLVVACADLTLSTNTLWGVEVVHFRWFCTRTCTKGVVVFCLSLYLLVPSLGFGRAPPWLCVWSVHPTIFPVRLLSVVGGGGKLVEFEPVWYPAAAHVPAGGGGWTRLVHAGVSLLLWCPTLVRPCSCCPKVSGGLLLREWYLPKPATRTRIVLITDQHVALLCSEIPVAGSSAWRSVSVVLSRC